MIKQNSRDLKYYKYSKLYLDEINDLLDIIQENGFKYKITINNFELESREEIEKFSEKKVEKFEIYISEIRFHIEIVGIFLLGRKIVLFYLCCQLSLVAY